MQIRPLLLLFTAGFLFFTACETPEPPSIFGKYYKIGDIQLPFKGKPYIIPAVENVNGTISSYQYVFTNSNMDENYSYGVDLAEIKVAGYPDETSKVNYFANDRALLMTTKANGVLVYQDVTTFRERFAVNQKMRMTVPGAGDFYMTSLYFFNKGKVVRMSVLTSPENDNNEKIEGFFESIKL